MEDEVDSARVFPSPTVVSLEEVLTGNIGCLSGKMKFGCMGDPVNLAGGPRGVQNGNTWNTNVTRLNGTSID